METNLARSTFVGQLNLLEASGLALLLMNQTAKMTDLLKESLTSNVYLITEYLCRPTNWPKLEKIIAIHSNKSVNPTLKLPPDRQ